MCVLGPDSSCITPDILRKCALVARHESPSSSVRLSGGSWAAESKATKPPTRPMIERTRTWSQPNHPPAVLDNFGGGPPVPGGRMPKPSWTTPRCRAQARQAQARQFRCASRLPALLIQAKQADHPTHAETESWPNLTKRTEPAKAAPVLLCLYCLSPRSLVRLFARSLFPPACLLTPPPPACGAWGRSRRSRLAGASCSGT
jgi:hypothetical protein